MIAVDFVPTSADATTIERSTTRAFCIEWWHMCTTAWGQDCLVRETQGFGGYGIRFRFADTFWRFNSSSWAIDDVFSDFYALPPGSSTPITCPNCNWRVQWASQLNCYLLVLSISGNAGIVSGGPFPQAPYGFYRPFPPLKNATDWQLWNMAPTVLYPQPHC